jgi:SEC-C motif-containing protein
LKAKDCPCFSDLRYAACCGPIHRGEREAATPEELMRSRYSAFALGLGAYLVKTLSSDHADRRTRGVAQEQRQRDEAALARELSRAKDRQRFLGLTIHGSSDDGATGEVTFHARIFEKGRDRSFTERSAFVREHGAWRYAGGEIVESAGDALRAPGDAR